MWGRFAWAPKAASGASAANPIARLKKPRRCMDAILFIISAELFRLGEVMAITTNQWPAISTS